MIIFAFFGVLMLVISSVLKKSLRPEQHNVARIFQILGLPFIILGILLSCVVQIDPGQIGVPTLFGKVQSQILHSGLHFVNPLLAIKEFETRTQNYTMSAVHDEGDKMGDDAIRVLSADGLEVVLDVTILFKIIPEQAPKILSELGQDYKDVIIRPISRTKIRDFSVYYNAIDLFSTKREEFQQKVFTAIEKDFAARGIVLEQMLVRNIELPASVKASIEAKINAEQDAQKMEFVLQKETQEAERKRVEAQGIADYQKIISLTLNDKQLQYESIKAQRDIATSPNAKVIIMGNSKNPIMLNSGN